MTSRRNGFSVMMWIFWAGVVGCGGGGGPAKKDAIQEVQQEVAKEVEQDAEADVQEGIVDEFGKDAAPDIMQETEEDVPQDLPGDAQQEVETGQDALETEQEVAQEVEEPGPQPVPPIFRASKLWILYPEFCYDPDQDGTCNVDTELVNAYIQSAIDDTKAPLNFLLRFIPLDYGDPETYLVVGHGACQFDGQSPVACGFSQNEVPVIFEGPLFPEQCPQDTACFETPKKKLEVILLGVFVALHDASLKGQFDDPAKPTVVSGQLGGFLPLNTAKSIVIVLGGESVLLSDLLAKNELEELNGVKGYTLQMSFEAQAVSFLE